MLNFLLFQRLMQGRVLSINCSDQALENAVNRGFKYAHTEAAGNISQHIFMNKFGFEEKNKIAYDEFVFKGEKLFSSTETHQSIKLLIKEL